MPQSIGPRFSIFLLLVLCISTAPTIHSWSNDSIEEKLVYVQNEGVPAALHLLRPLAEKGDAEAQYRIGQLYEGAPGIIHSGTNALEWYRQSADQGHANAQFSLGRLYVIGRDVSQDYVQAYKWFILAESRFSDSNANARARATKARKVISPMMTSAQISKAQDLAANWESN